MYPNLPTYYFTQSKLDSIKKELEKLIESRETAVIELAEARSLGDLSENGRYKAARQNLTQIDKDIRQHKIWIKYAAIIKPSHNHNQVSLGSIVEVKQNGIKKIFSLVGKLEANPMEGKISNKSPIGEALMHKRVGDKITVKVPAGEIELEVIKID